MKKPSILIVEDEPAILRALERVFLGEKFRVLTARDGKKGLAIAIKHHPELILFDIVMPTMDGMSMLRAIRETKGTWGKTVKAIVYSNLSFNEKREEAERLGVVDFLVKANLPLVELATKVRETLEVEA